MQPFGNVDNGVRHMAMDRVIGNTFPEFRKMMYVLDTSELFADRNAVIYTESFFKRKALSDSRYAAIDVVSTLCKDAHIRQGPSWGGIAAADDVKSLVKAYDHALIVAPYRRRFDLEYLSQVRVFSRATKNILKDEDMVQSLLGAENGLAESNLLCKYIAERHPERFRDVLCIRPKYISDSSGLSLRNATEKILHISPQKYYPLPDVSDEEDDGLDEFGK